MRIQVCWSYPEFWRAKSLSRRAALAVLEAEDIANAELSIAVVDSHEMSRLHMKYLHKHTPTDVLTFDLGSDLASRRIDGEIVVCADVARKRASQRSHKLSDAKAELALYIVHGLLHLIGYDDHKPADFARMHAREDEILQGIGLGPVFASQRSSTSLDDS